MGTLAEAAASLKRAAGSSLPALLLMTDEARLADPLPAANALPAGSGIILRHYGAPEREALARRLAAAIARRRGLVLLVGEDPALARRVGAHGVHLPERAIGRAGAVRWQRDWLITAAAHSHAALRAAAVRWRRCRSALPGFRHGEPPRCPRPRPPPLRCAGARQPSPGLCPRRHRQRPRASPARQRRRWNRRHRRAHSSDSASPVRAKCRAQPSYRGGVPPSRGMISTAVPRAAAGAWGGRTIRHCAFTSSDSIELSCFAKGVAISAPFSSRTSVARR